LFKIKKLTSKRQELDLEIGTSKEVAKILADKNPNQTIFSYLIPDQNFVLLDLVWSGFKGPATSSVVVIKGSKKFLEFCFLVTFQLLT